MFACGSGMNEDPITGSAHPRIVPYWLRKWGGTALKCRQVSARAVTWTRCGFATKVKCCCVVTV
ncbi:hypothetical protein C8R45DRAFT_976213 [Mycena sanguinolenta]|nr:hypothetical protein C8R45DRAFT_976213 [Mycena sanguinolenta]